MIYRAPEMRLPLRLLADLCVVGSGAGGSMAAMTAARAGLSVIVLEAGDFVPPELMNQREEDMFPQLFWANGGRTSSDRRVKIHQGRGFGGSTLHNLNLCSRIPAPVRREWRRDRGTAHLPEKRWRELYEEVETLLGVGAVPAARWNRHNRLLLDGAGRLGWAAGGLRHNRSGCIGSGFCELGCAYDAKNNALKVPLSRALAAGADAVVLCQAVAVRHAAGRVQAVEAVALDPIDRRPIGRVEVLCDRVCLAASATGTAALLQRSKVPDPSNTTGRSLRIHPAVVAAGELAEPVRAWEGIPQTCACSEHLDFERAHPEQGGGPEGPGSRTWLVPAFAHPVGTSTMMPGLGADHRRLMERYDRMAVFSAMIHDRTAGRVRPQGRLGLRIDYELVPEDERELLFGLRAASRLLFAAGAERVIIPTNPPLILESERDLPRLDKLNSVSGAMDITAVHPMGTVPMGDDPRTAAVDSRGRHHHLGGLWIADASLFPTSIGVPPQISTYAMGLHVGQDIGRG
jgi:choline dehydrogenase-like flavoprotein